MRPGPEGPGCAEADADAVSLLAGFNEAGAGRPRMPGEPVGSIPVTRASMRPGPEGPGCLFNNLRAILPSDRFNEAGAGRPRMPCWSDRPRVP